MAHGRPAPQPALQGRRVDGALERGPVTPWRPAGGIGSDPPRAVEQGEAGLLLRQPGHQIAQSREDGQADPPSVSMVRAEQCDLAQHRRGWLARGEEATHRLGDDQIQLVGQAVRQPPAPVAHRVGPVEYGLYPDINPADFDRTGGHVVGPQVERAAAGQIEPGVMPMAGQDAVLDRAAVEREAHVRAPVVESADTTILADHEHRPVGFPQHYAALGLQFRERADANELVACFTHSCPSRAGSESIVAEPTEGEGLSVVRRSPPASRCRALFRLPRGLRHDRGVAAQRRRGSRRGMSAASCGWRCWHPTSSRRSSAAGRTDK